MVEPESQVTDSLGQVDMVSVVVSIPVGIVSTALYDLIKFKLNSYLEAQKIREVESDDL